MGKKILLVEDFDDVRDAMRILIELHGHYVIEATDGYEAYSRAKTERPDLILMDISMPFFDGIEASRKIKSDPELARIPIVVVTAFSPYYNEAAIAAGCDEVIAKPDLISNLTEVIHSLLARHVDKQTIAD